MLPIGVVAGPVEPVGLFPLLEDGNNLGLTTLSSGCSIRMCPPYPSFHQEGIESSCDSDWHAEHPSHRQHILSPQDNYLANGEKLAKCGGKVQNQPEIKDFLVAELMFRQ